MLDLRPHELRDVVGFGVAGNFAGHLEQAGEAADFLNVAAAEEAPKGIFPWYVPKLGPDGRGEAASRGEVEVPGFLTEFPLSDTTIVFPAAFDNLQIEPELGLLADVTYDGGGLAALVPRAVAAFNDCSIRRPGANKISEKKNWGPCSKGLAVRGFAVDDLSAEGPTASFRLASFLVRDGEAHAYGQDSAVRDYSYYGVQLLDWILERLENQLGSVDTPLEPVGRYLAASGRTRVLIGIGATRYTRLGESTYLVPGDESVVVLYDEAVHRAGDVARAVNERSEHDLGAASVLRQRVVAA